MNGLIEKKVQVVRNGKTFTQTVWVKPEVQSSNKELSQLEDLFKKDKLAGLQKLKDLGIAWKENAHPAINLMRAKEAMKKHFGSTQPNSLPKSTQAPSEKTTKQSESTSSYLASLTAKGITWEENPHPAINLMRAKMAEKKFNENSNKKFKVVMKPDSERVTSKEVLTSAGMSWAHAEASKFGMTLETDDKTGFIKGYTLTKDGEIIEKFKTFRSLDEFLLNLVSVEDNQKPDITLPEEMYDQGKTLTFNSYDSKGNLILSDKDNPDSPFKTVILKADIDKFLARQSREKLRLQKNKEADEAVAEAEERNTLIAKFTDDCLGFEQGKDAKTRANIAKYLNTSVTRNGKLFSIKDLYIHLLKEGYEYRETYSGLARWYLDSNTFLEVTDKTAKDFSEFIYQKPLSVLDSAFRGDSFVGLSSKDKWLKVVANLTTSGEKADPVELREYCIGAGLDDEHVKDIVTRFGVKFPSQFFKRCTKFSKSAFDIAKTKGVEEFDNVRIKVANELLVDENMYSQLVSNISSEGFCGLRSDVGKTIEDTETVDFSRLVLKPTKTFGVDENGNKFNMTQKVTTSYHESFHATANGRKTLFGGFEESLAELVAYGLGKNLGHNDHEVISYVPAVGITYLMLKSKPEFSDCNGMADVGMKILQMLENDDYDRTKFINSFPELKIHEKLIKNGTSLNYSKASWVVGKLLPNTLPTTMPTDFPEFIANAHSKSDPKSWSEDRSIRLTKAWVDVVRDKDYSDDINVDCVLQYILQKGVI